MQWPTRVSPQVAAVRAPWLTMTVGAVLGLLVLVPVSSPGAQETSMTAAQLRLDLDRLRGQITALEAQLTGMAAQRDTLVDEFETADVVLALSRRQLELIQLRLQVLYQQSVDREAEVIRLTEALVTAREELAVRIVALYRMGPLSYSRFLFAADNPEEILANYQLIGRLAAQDRTLVANIATRMDVGILGFEMFTGKLPFEGRSAQEMMIARLRGSATPLRRHRPDLPAQLEEVLGKSMEANPDNRYASAEEFGTALADLL